MMALQNIIVYSVDLADNIMLGGYNELSLSGVALANQILFLINMISSGISGAMMVLISQYWGKRDIESIKRITAIGFNIGLAFSLFMWVVVFFFSRNVLGLLTNNAAIIEESVKYIRISCFTYALFMSSKLLLATLRSVETVRIGFIVSVGAFVVNVFLNYVFIYGNLGAPELGIRGAAIATLIARVGEIIVLMIYVLFVDKKIHLKLKDFMVIDKQLLRRYTKIGLPVIASDTLWGIAMAIQTSILGHLGGEAIAANSIAVTIFQIVTVVCYASGNAASVIVGKTIGEGRIDDVKQYSKTMQVLFGMIGVATGLILFFLKDFILAFYTISDSTKQLADMFMLVLCITVVGTSYECPTLTGIVRGGGDTKFVFYNDLIFMWLISIPSATLVAFVFKLSPVIVFICLKMDQVLKSFVGLIKVNKGNWIRDITV